MAALLALQSSLHCLAVFCSAIADGDKASSPSNAAHTAKVGFITHLSGKTPPTHAARSHSAGEKETAALAAAMWSAAPDRQRDYCSLFVLAVSRTKSERRHRKTAAPPGRRRRTDCRPICYRAVNGR